MTQAVLTRVLPEGRTTPVAINSDAVIWVQQIDQAKPTAIMTMAPEVVEVKESFSTVCEALGFAD